MKIIKPSGKSDKSRESVKSESTHSSETDQAKPFESRGYSEKPSPDFSIKKESSAKIAYKKGSQRATKEWNRTDKKRRGKISKKRSQLSNDDYQSSTKPIRPEEEFDFDTSTLEAMPKDELIEAPIDGKKRRKSELEAIKESQPLQLVTDPEKKAFNEFFARGVRLLAMREHSVKEMTNKLFDKSGEGDDVSSTIYAVIDELLENKYLSDERFTESYIRSRSNRGFGPVKIRAELKDKGVSNNLIQDNLDQGAGLWFDNAKSQYQKKYGNTVVDDYKAWTKRARFLQSRGFTMEQIHCAVAPVANT